MNYRMADKGIQVAIGLKRPQLSSQATQTPSTKTKENGTQCGHGRGSYARKREYRQWRYDDLVRWMIDKEVLMEWLIVEGLLAKSVFCPQCNKEMKLVTCNDRWDGLKWECRIQTSGKWHKTETSIRKGSWFSQSNMALEEILKCTYWWCQDLEQSQIMHELGLVRSTGVDWDSFCREVCEMTMFDSSQKITLHRKKNISTTDLAVLAFRLKEGLDSIREDVDVCTSSKIATLTKLCFILWQPVFCTTCGKSEKSAILKSGTAWARVKLVIYKSLPNGRGTSRGCG